MNGPVPAVRSQGPRRRQALGLVPWVDGESELVVLTNKMMGKLDPLSLAAPGGPGWSVVGCDGRAIKPLLPEHPVRSLKLWTLTSIAAQPVAA